MRVVFFDVGETLVRETRMWAVWAEHLGVSPDRLIAVLEDVVGRGLHHHEALRYFVPDLVVETERRKMAARGKRFVIQPCDLYPDAVACLDRVRQIGCRVGIAGNQPLDTERDLRALGLSVDIVASSAGLGVAKPDAAFFVALCDLVGVTADEIAYVGDRLDNDILPAQAIGMTGIFLERGPWGRAQATWVEAQQADLTLRKLEDLPDLLAGLLPQS